MPSHDEIKSNKYLKVFGNLLHDPNLFHLNRRSAAGAFAVGLFVAFVPLPMQMVIAAAAAILLRVNMPLSIALVWISNPLTMPPLFYGCYRLGLWLTGHPPVKFSLELSVEGMINTLMQLGTPFLLGCLICGATAALLGYISIRILWRMMVCHHLKLRKQRCPHQPR